MSESKLRATGPEPKGLETRPPLRLIRERRVSGARQARTHRASEVQPTWAWATPYRLVRKLGSEGFAFEALHRHTGRRVVIRLLPDLTDLEALAQRFSPIAELQHPAIARVFDVGVVDSPQVMGFVVRDYVDGTSLAEHLKESPRLSLASSCDMLSQVLEALSYAHTRGVIFGGLDPSRVVLKRSQAHAPPRVCLHGFGYEDDVSRHGTREYCAPEVASGGRAQVQSDVYSAGALLARALFGEVTAQCPARLRGEHSESLLAFIATALSPDPSARFASAEAMLGELRCIAKSTPVGPARSGVSPALGERSLPVEQVKPMATRPVTIWVLDDDPALHSRNVVDALAALSAKYETVRIPPGLRASTLLALEEGKRSPPWLVLYGGLSVLLNEPLLLALQSSAETAHMLISGADNISSLKSALAFGGLQAFASPHADVEIILTLASRTVERTRSVALHYDGLRTQLAQRRQDLRALSLELAALD